MADGLSIVGSIAVNPTALAGAAAPGQPYFIPARPGTLYYETAAVRAATMAAGVPDYYAFTQGISMCYADVVTVCPTLAANNWFSAAILNGAFQASATTGYMSSYATDQTTGMGPIQFAVAQNSRADDGAPLTFPGCRFDNLRLTWTAGREIIARFRIWLFGPPTKTTTVPAVTMLPAGALLMGQKVTCSGFTRLFGGEIRISGQMQPDPTSLSTDDGHGKQYVTNFYNAVPPKMSIDLTQAVGSTVVAPTHDDTNSSQAIVFNKSTGAAVTLTAGMLAPDISKPIDYTLPLFTRTYDVASVAQGTASFVFS